MKTVVRPDLNSKTFCISKSHSCLKVQEKSLIDFKFYQKLLVVIISLSTFLIFPESPGELEKLCQGYNSIKLCNVW